MLKRAEDVEDADIHRYSTYVFDFLYGYIDEDGDGKQSAPTLDDYANAARELFGLSYTAGFFDVFNEDENGSYVYVNGHGGNVYQFDFVESGDSYAVVQFYADYNCTVKSHLVRYDFAEGEYLGIVSSEIIEESQHEPCHYGV